MDLRLQLVAVAASLLLLVVVFELVRRKRLLERYALLWLLSAFVLLLLSAWRDLLEHVATAIGIHYAPSALFVIAFSFVLLLLLHFSLVVSRLADQSKVLAQRLALLEERHREHEMALAEQGEHENGQGDSPRSKPFARSGRG
ncbi:MAG TPA: DUF2304 domain-containing protein [Thermoleophilaceae bacterium]|nr:DUF2304 domain-containing protein [Thermoleophilaceae bacterium]